MKLLVKYLIVGMLLNVYLFAFNWPVKESYNKRINSTMGEYRPGHLHAGIDVKGYKGTKVYPVVNGIVDTIGSDYVKIEGNDGKFYDYVHIVPSSSLQRGKYVYKNSTLLGTTNNQNHIHLEINDGGENPLKSLDNFSDSGMATVYSFDFYKQGSNSKITATYNGLPLLSGKIDILAHARDKQSSGSSQNTAPYKICYMVKDKNNYIKIHKCNIQFDQTIGKSLGLIYDTSKSTSSSYYYWVTNKMNSNSYLDTTNLPNGEYKITVYADDIDGGAYDISSSIGAETKRVYIKNDTQNSSFPKPNIVSIDYPDSVQQGDYATITVKVRNDGDFSDAGYITVSFPGITDKNLVQPIRYDGELTKKSKGDKIYHSGDYQTKAQYLMVESTILNWGKNETKTLSFKIKMNKTGSNIFYTRVAMHKKGAGYSDSDYARDPISGTPDQQGWYAEKRTISVNKNSFSTKINIHTKRAEGGNYGGLTIITHGLMSDTDDWVQEMGDAISRKQYGHTVHIYRLKFNDGVINFEKIAGSHTKDADSLIVLLDWAEDAQLLKQDDTESYVAQRAVQYLMSNNISNKFFQLPIHLIGHSRGGSVVSHIAEELGKKGLVVDQLTMLDPHPMDKKTYEIVIDGVLTLKNLIEHTEEKNYIGTFKDWWDFFTDQAKSYPPKVFENVIYSDTYFQESNKLRYLGKGEPGIIGYCSSNKSECNDITGFLAQADFGGINLITNNEMTWHSSVHAYYFGTILNNFYDKNNYTYYNNSYLSQKWYFFDQRKELGFNKTRFGLGNKGVERKPQGINKKLKGLLTINPSGDRNYIRTCSSNAYPNIIFPSNIDGSEDITVSNDTSFSISFITQYCLQNRNLKITLYLDNDKNPFNGAKYLLGKYNITSDSNFKRYRVNIEKEILDKISAGDYYVRANIYDSYNGNERYDYNMYKLVITKEKEEIANANRPPYKPSAWVSLNDIIGERATVTLKTSNFSDPNSGDTHWKTWWGLRKDGHYIWHSGWSTSNKTSITLPNLDFDTTYSVDVRHMDNHGVWSPYRRVTFTTQPAPTPSIEVANAVNIMQNEALVWTYYNNYGVRNSKTYLKWGKTRALSHQEDEHTIGINESGSDYKLDNLECGTTYYYQAVISNSRGRNESDIKSFTTKPCGAKIKFISPDGKPEIIEFGNVKIGECATKKVTIIKINNQGSVNGNVKILTYDNSQAYNLKGSNSFNLSNQNDKKEFEVEFCPTDKKTYTSFIQAETNEDVEFELGWKAIILKGSGVENNDGGEAPGGDTGGNDNIDSDNDGISDANGDGVNNIDEIKSGTDSNKNDNTSKNNQSTLSEADVSKLYVAIFNRASEGKGNRYWQTQGSMEEVANLMLNTKDAKEYFGDHLNDNQAFIEWIYKNTLNKEYYQDPDGIEYWTNELNKGLTRGEVVVNLINAIDSYKNTTDEITKRAYNQFINRVKVSNYMAEHVYNVPSNYKITTGFAYDLYVGSKTEDVDAALELIDSLAELEEY